MSDAHIRDIDALIRAVRERAESRIETRDATDGLLHRRVTLEPEQALALADELVALREENERLRETRNAAIALDEALTALVGDYPGAITGQHVALRLATYQSEPRRTERT